MSCDPFPETISLDIYVNTYYDNSNYDNMYKELKQILQQSASSLDNSKLVDYFNRCNLIYNNGFIEYICDKDDVFNQIYTSHYVKCDQSFKLMTCLQSMCQSWLMYLYH